MAVFLFLHLFLMNRRICSRETNSLLLVLSSYYALEIVSFSFKTKIFELIFFVLIDDNAVRVIQENTFASVVAFIKRVDDVAAKSEATRVLTNLIKTIWVEKDNLDIRNQVIEAHIIEPIIELIRTSTYAVLKNDGIMALTLIFSDPESKSVLSKGICSLHCF